MKNRLNFKITCVEGKPKCLKCVSTNFMKSCPPFGIICVLSFLPSSSCPSACEVFHSSFLLQQKTQASRVLLHVKTARIFTGSQNIVSEKKVEHSRPSKSADVTRIPRSHRAGGQWVARTQVASPRAVRCSSCHPSSSQCPGQLGCRLHVALGCRCRHCVTRCSQKNCVTAVCPAGLTCRRRTLTLQSFYPWFERLATVRSGHSCGFSSFSHCPFLAVPFA